MGRVQVVHIFPFLALALPFGNANAEWTWLAEDSQGTSVYIDQATLRQKNDGALLWSLLDFKKTQIVANVPFRSSRAQHQYDCRGERMRIKSMSFHSENMGLGKTVHSDSAPKEWEPVSPTSIGSASFEHACSLFSKDGTKHKFSKDEIPGWNQGPSSKQADTFFDPKSIRTTDGMAKMWVITNFKEPQRIDGKLHWSSKARIEYDCRNESSRIDGAYFYPLPYAKGNVSGMESSSNEWYPIAEKGLARGLASVACKKRER